MKDRMAKIKVILITFTFFTDSLFFISLLHFLHKNHLHINLYIIFLFWVITFLFLITFLRFKFDQTQRKPSRLAGIYRVGGLFLTLYLPKIIFIIFQLLNFITVAVIHGTIYLLNIIFSKDFVKIDFNIFSYVGIILGGLIFLMLIYVNR